MERKIKNQKGITLVALVITIIVMLILVAVSVTVAINGGLFTKAKEAGNSWEAQSKEEADGNIVNVDGTITTIDGAIESLSGTTTQTPEATTITFTLEGTTYTTNEGTTWEKWVEEETEQEFNDYGYGSWFECNETRVLYITYTPGGMGSGTVTNAVCWTDAEGNYDNTRPVSPTETIVDGAVYKYYI